jgi:hypothetical protein
MMNIMQVIGVWSGFYFRQHQTIAALVGTGGDGKKAALLMDFVKANAPLIKAVKPELNQNGLLDDFVNSLEETIAGPVVQS